MSCHDIGLGMASVANVVIELYEGGRFEKDVAIRLIRACRKGVHWCDGNEGEAMQTVVESGYCGLCFEKKEGLSWVFDNDLGYPDNYKVFKAYDITAAHNFLCQDCKTKVINEYRDKNHMD